MPKVNKIATLCYILNDCNQVLLIMKKRGFGAGKYNGPGGKLEAGETPLQAVIREVKEEVGINIFDPQDLGYIEFYFPENKDDWNQRVHIFITRNFDGQPKESEECAPQWFDLDKIPYEQMWDDDQYWYPQALAGERLKKCCYFDDDNKVIKFCDLD